MSARTKKYSEEVTITDPIYQIRFDNKENRFTKRLEEDDRCHLNPGPHHTYFVTNISLKFIKTKHYHFKIVRKIIPQEAGLKIIYPLDCILHRLPPDYAQAEVLAMALSKKDGKKVPIPIYCGRTHEKIPHSFVLDQPGGKRHYKWRWERRKQKRATRSIKELFPKLIRTMTDPQTRFVISLGGGGLRLFAHPSLFKLIEELGAKDSIAEVWGCSGGSIAGLAYCLGADHEIIEKEGYHLYRNKFSVEFSPRNKSLLKTLIFHKFFAEHTIGLRGFVDIQTTLQDSLARITLNRRPHIPFYAIAYNVSTKRNEVLTPVKITPKIYNGLIKRCSPIDAVLASTAIPILFVPRVIKRGRTPVTYIDGGVSEELPLLSIYNKWLIDRKHGVTQTKRLFIISVNLFPHLSHWSVFQNAFLSRIPLIAYMKVITKIADLVRQSRIEEHISHITTNGNVQLAQMNLGDLQRSGFLDPQIIPEVIDKAKGNFFKQLRVIEQRLK